MPDHKNCEEFRKAAISRIEGKLSARSQDVGDPFWNNGSYNAAKWSVRGSSAAIDLLEKTSPFARGNC